MVHDLATALFSQPCEFIAGAASLESLIPISVPEVAFIGRSNVGKSSLINALVGQKALARTSQNPGLTSQLNFFHLGARPKPQLMLVDMPGYGFARVSKTKKGEWDQLIRSYLLGRTTLKRTCVLIDARRGVMPIDEDFMTLLDNSAASFQLVLTKTDALTAGDLGVIIKQMESVAGKHVAAHPHVVATSALQKEGVHALQTELAAFAEHT